MSALVEGIPTTRDTRGGYAAIYRDVMGSPAWQALSFSQKALYVELRAKMNGSNNGNIEATVGTLRSAGFTAPATLFKNLRALQVVGLIEKTRQGQVSDGGKTCNLFRFTDLPVSEFPGLGIKKMRATNDWKQFGTLADARQAIEEAHRVCRRPSREPIHKARTRKVQALN